MRHAAPNTPDLYIYFILLTSRSTKAEMLQAFQQGADDFLSKPIAAIELHARVTAAARLLDTQRKLKLKNRQIKAALRKTQALNAAMDKDLLAAQQLQTALIHNRHRRFGRFDIAALVENTGPVGGDLAGFFTIGATHIGFYIADVSGHDIGTARFNLGAPLFCPGWSPLPNSAGKKGHVSPYWP